jgi:hypothetical protein
MAKPGGVVRMNISIPAELRKQMDGVPGSVNWSAVAAGAFRDKVERLLARRKGAMKKEDVIARLKLADERDDDEAWTDGEEAGERWAQRKATPKQLRRLDEKFDRELFSGVPDAYGWAGVLYGLIVGEHHGDEMQIRAYWESVLGDGDDALRIENESFAEGFVEGALKEWQSLKEEIN